MSHAKEPLEVCTEDDILEFRAAYARAVEQGAESFTAFGKEVLTSYARYLLEYIELMTSSDGEARFFLTNADPN